MKHEVIMASAGCGKTYRLAHRYIDLLVQGRSPDQICALTFSRKAAGEILDSIVKYLREAASDSGACSRTAAYLGRPDLRPPDFQACLRRLLESLHRAMVGTLDAFTLSILKSFPVELGLPHDFRLMDGEGTLASLVNRRVLENIFHPDRLPDEQRRQFREAFKQATYGREEKNLEKTITGMVQASQHLYRALPRPEAWGRAEAVWPGGLPQLLRPDPTKPEVHLEILLAALAAGMIKGSSRGSVEKFARYCASYSEKVQWNDTVFNPNFQAAVLERFPLPEDAALTLSFGKQEALVPAGVARALNGLIAHVFRVEVEKALRQTRGLHEVLMGYEAQYDRLMRSQGLVSFSDAQFLVTGRNPFFLDRKLSTVRDDDERLYINYRLNCRLDHLLLDEFQDTSDLQWMGLADLADEIVQDAEGGRSLFIVGDVKQAIYSWRGGNARIIDGITSTYGEKLERGELAESYRSCPPVIEAVNRVFSDPPAVIVGDEARGHWMKKGAWMEHVSAPHLRDLEGCAMLLEAIPAEEKYTDDDAVRLTASLLREIDPVRKGLSTAVLVRTNREGRYLVDELRKACPDMHIILEGRGGLRDCPVVEVMRSLVCYAFHPGNLLAREHLCMSLLGDSLAAFEPDRSRLACALLRQVHDHGFASFFQYWSAQLEAAAAGRQEGGLSEFEFQRLDLLGTLAMQFDETGSRDGDLFVNHLDQYSFNERSEGHGIRVMTVHQSKGLGFDIVMLPHMDKAFSKGLSYGTVLHARRDPEWVLQLPHKQVFNRVAPLDCETSRAESDQVFEGLCLLYVAMTRAKRGLYMFVPPAAGAAEKKDWASFLRNTLAEGTSEPTSFEDVPAHQLFLAGRRDWHQSGSASMVLQDPECRPPQLLAWAALPPVRKLPAWKTPSSLGHELGEDAGMHVGSRRAAVQFSGESLARMEWGQVVHELFEQVAWIEDVDPAGLVDAWEGEHPETTPAQRGACRQFLEAVEKADIRRALSREVREEVSRMEIWTERSFVCLHGERTVLSGKFDRVVISRDAAGRAVQAEVLDYKTTRFTGTPKTPEQVAETYRAQMEAYRDCLCGMLELPPGAVSMKLLFTEPGILVELG